MLSSVENDLAKAYRRWTEKKNGWFDRSSSLGWPHWKDRRCHLSIRSDNTGARRPDGSVGMALVLPALTNCRWWFESLLVHSGVSSVTRRKATGADHKKKKWQHWSLGFVGYWGGPPLGVQILNNFPTQKRAWNKSNNLMTTSCAFLRSRSGVT